MTPRWMRRLAAWALLLAACAPVTPPPTYVVQIPTSRPTATPLPTSTPTATAPRPTPTARPTQTATSPPAPAPTATPEGRLGPDAFPPGINPLTGLPADPAALAAAPLVVKVSNAPACVRPQHGLAQADVIFEHYVEAWATRFTAIYNSQYPARIGSVRSARLLDIELPAIFGAGLVFSGASGGVQRRIDESDFADRALHGLDLCPVLCRVPAASVPCRDFTHTLFADALAAQGLLARRGLTEATVPLSGWSFSARPPAGAAAAAVLDVDYLNAPVRWTYDPALRVYRRAQSGASHTDAATGLTLAASNVVILFANHVYSDIQESTLWYSLEIQFWGTGPALVFRDGYMLEGTWLRQQRSGLFTLADLGGDVIPLRPGQTWFELVGLASTRAESDGRWRIDPEELPQQTPPQRP